MKPIPVTAKECEDGAVFYREVNKRGVVAPREIGGRIVVAKDDPQYDLCANGGSFTFESTEVGSDRVWRWVGVLPTVDHETGNLIFDLLPECAELISGITHEDTYGSND